MKRRVLALAAAGLLCSIPAATQSLPRGKKWVASWTASAHGPYPSGNASAQPLLDSVFESAERGAADQALGGQRVHPHD